VKALIVEDSASYQLLVANAMNQLGVETASAATGQEALELFASDTIDLIVLDLHIDDMTGFELCSRFRESEVTRSVPVVLLMSEEDDLILKKGYDVGVTDILKKGDFEDVGASLQSVVEGMRRAHRGRVLYVEDSPTVAQLTVHLLEGMQLEVDHFESAEEALEALDERDYDVVIVDIVLSGAMNGVSLTRTIRGLEGQISEVPIIAISGHEDTARRLEALRQGANDYLSKPVERTELAIRIGNLLTTKHLIDQLRASEGEMRKLAMIDQLTGLNHRQSLISKAPRAINAARRRKESFSILLLDIDCFKAINDEHGHVRGDEVLNAIGEYFLSAVKDDEIASRIGGEEFVILLPDCDPPAAMDRAESIRRQIKELQPMGLPITVSIGVSTINDETEAVFDDLYRSADKALYQAKRDGRDRVRRGEEITA
jgi:two-component system, cell cycle response regulator